MPSSDSRFFAKDIEAAANSKQLPTILGAKAATKIGASESSLAAEREHDSKQRKVATVTLARHASLQFVTATSFAMGLAWKAATMAIVDPKNYMQDPSEVDNIGKLWALTAIVVVAFMVLIGILVKYSLVLQRRLKQEIVNNQSIVALTLRGRIQSIDAIVGWGLTFAVAAQIDTAMEASVQKDPPTWRILYLAGLVLVVCVLVALLQQVSKPKNAKIANLARTAGSDVAEVNVGAKVTDVILSGAAYVVALATLGVSDAMFKLNNVSTSEDLTYIGIYAGVSVIVAALALVVLSSCDSREATAAKDMFISHTGTEVPYTLGIVFRKLLSKVFAMCAVLACYAFLYVWLVGLLSDDGQASVYDPLPIKGALIFTAVAFGVSVFGWFLSKCVLDAAVSQLAAVDRDVIPGTLDDTFLDSLEALVTTTASTLLESIAWLVGCAVNALAVALWTELIKDRLVKDEGDLSNILAVCGFAIFMSVVAVVSAICLPN